MDRVRLLPFVALTALLVGGCPKPPTKALTEAEDAVGAARDKAPCAKEKFEAAERLLDEARTLNEEKKYDAAERKAKAAKRLAREAEREAEANWEDCMNEGDEETADETTSDDEESSGGDDEGPSDEKIAELSTVYFEFDSASLSDEARETLQSNVRWFRQNPDKEVVLEGHTDSRGSVSYNLALGERRAKTVKDYLEQSGISADRLRVVSYGEEKPEAFGDSESAYRKNRRVEFVPE